MVIGKLPDKKLIEKDFNKRLKRITIYEQHIKKNRTPNGRFKTTGRNKQSQRKEDLNLLHNSRFQCNKCNENYITTATKNLFDLLEELYLYHKCTDYKLYHYKNKPGSMSKADTIYYKIHCSNIHTCRTYDYEFVDDVICWNCEDSISGEINSYKDTHV
jgi:hypothetical protein